MPNKTLGVFPERTQSDSSPYMTAHGCRVRAPPPRRETSHINLFARERGHGATCRLNFPTPIVILSDDLLPVVCRRAPDAHPRYARAASRALGLLPRRRIPVAENQKMPPVTHGFAGVLRAPGIERPNSKYDGRRHAPCTAKQYDTAVPCVKRGQKKGFLYNEVNAGFTPSEWLHVITGGDALRWRFLLEACDGDDEPSLLAVDYDPNVSESFVEEVRLIHDAHLKVRTNDKAVGDMVGIGDHLRCAPHPHDCPAFCPAL